MARKHAISMGEFSKINTNYDETAALAKPKKTWRDRARCAGLPPELVDPIFFPVAESGVPITTQEDIYAEARDFCRKCPVKTACTNEALEEEGLMPFGFRGNKTAEERLVIYKRRVRIGMIQPRQRRSREPIYFSRKPRESQPEEPENE